MNDFLAFVWLRPPQVTLFKGTPPQAESSRCTRGSEVPSGVTLEWEGLEGGLEGPRPEDRGTHRPSWSRLTWKNSS